MEAKQKKKFNKKSLIVWSFFFILLFFVFFLFLGHIKVTNYKTFEAKYEDIEILESNLGVSVWNESLIYAEYDGKIVYNKENGERVYKGEPICSVAINPNANILSRLDDINKILSQIDNSYEGEKYFDFDKNAKDEQLINLREFLSENKYSDAKNAFRSLNVYERNNKNPVGYTYDELVELKETLKNKIVDSEKQYSSKISGILSYSTDNLNIKFDQNGLNLMPKDIFNEIESIKNIDIETGDSVNEGHIIARIIDNYLWSIIYKISDDAFYKLKDKKSIYLRLYNEDNIYEENVYISAFLSDENNKYVVVNLKDYADFFFDKRIIKSELIFEKEKGIKIPNESIVKWHDIKGVYVQDFNNNIVFKPLNIVVEDESFVVSNLEKIEKLKDYSYNRIKVYDTIIIEPKLVSEADVLFPREKNN